MSSSLSGSRLSVSTEAAIGTLGQNMVTGKRPSRIDFLKAQPRNPGEASFFLL